MEQRGDEGIRHDLHLKPGVPGPRGLVLVAPLTGGHKGKRGENGPSDNSGGEGEL